MAGLKFVGFSSDFRRRAGDGISVNSQGIKNGTLIYEGDKNELGPFLAQWDNGTNHPDDSDLKKIGHQVSYRGPVAQVVMQFLGDIQGGGGLKISNIFRSKTAVLRPSTATNPEQRLINFDANYFSPSVTVQWTNGTEPATPQRLLESGIQAGDDVNIYFAKAQPIDAPPVLADPNNIFILNTDYTTRPVCEQFDITPLGANYLITETWSLVVDSKYDP